MNLKECYEGVKALTPDLDIDSFEMVEEVSRIRQFWRPEAVRVVLLAESHAHTRQQEFVNWEVPNTIYHGKFVRFVYCLANGESSLVPSVSRNTGTSQFWKILFSCLHKVSENRDFEAILRSTPQDKRIANKIALLSSLRQAGIWLMDASIVSINHLKDPTTRENILRYCWNYARQALQSLDPTPKHMIVIGSSVKNALKRKIASLGIDYKPVPQPQARLPAPGYFPFYKTYYEICSKFKN